MDEKEKVTEIVQEEKVEVKTEPTTKDKTNGLAIAALVLGIIALVLSLIPVIRYISYIVGPIGLILGIIALTKKQKKEMSIAAIVLAIVAILIVVIAQIRFNRKVNIINDALSDLSSSLDDAFADKTEEILAKELDVTLGDFVVTEGTWSSSTEMKVTLKNKSDKQKSFTVQIEAIDANGNRIDDYSVYTSNLGSGQSVEEKAFTWVTDEKLPSMKTATFRIINISSY